MRVPTLKFELPHWPGAKLFCSTRLGGCSSAPYDSLNLGDHVGDDPSHVSLNRQRLESMWGAQPVFMQQVHGTQVVRLPLPPEQAMATADACFTQVKNVACTVMVADCLPVLFYLPTAGVVAAAHAGWRGLAAGVIEQTLDCLAQHGSTAECKVWLGPCIGPLAFEVGEDVRQVFGEADGEALKGFVEISKSGKYFADLAWLAKRRLIQRGITEVQGNDSGQAWCTFSQPALFYSHRRDGVSGRFAVGIALV